MRHRPPGGLTSGNREALLSRVVQRKAAPPAARPQPSAPAAPSAATDFTTLPGFKEILTQRSLAEVIGIENPFFRVHEARAGATTAIDGRTFANFSSYDYLGMNAHPEVAAAAKAAIDRYGTSSSASRVVAGERPVHRELERALADLYGVEDCVVMVSGHGTNVGVIGHLLGNRDLIVHDALIHNSAVVGACLSGAERRSFEHNDLAALDALLGSVRHRFERALIVVEGLYSMDGDYPDLPQLIEIKTRHDAWLMVDEAHALGVLGQRGSGLAEHFGVDPRAVDIWMGTLSKTLAACGGYIAGPVALADYLKCTMSGFVYSVGMSPPVAAAAAAAIAVMRREPDRVARLQGNGALFRRLAVERGLDVGTSAGLSVIPVIVGDSLKAAMLSQRLFARGINVLPIVHPAVPERSARLRFFITSEHGEDQIRVAVDAVAEELATLSGTGAVLAQAARSLS